MGVRLGLRTLAGPGCVQAKRAWLYRPYISTSGEDAIWAITSQTGEVYEVYERPENLPPDVQQVLEELDAATITLAADGTVRIE